MRSSFLLVVALGCATPRERGGPAATDAVFPHPDGFKAGTMHGNEALQRGATICDTCHDGSTPTASTCDTCHSTYPHATDMVRGTVHGPLYADAGAEVCGACHGNPDLHANQGSACDHCHASYPHADGWEDAPHGIYALSRGSAVAACGNCHGADLSGGELEASSCKKCHADYPHPDGWTDIDQHGAAARKDIGDCESCHGVGGTGGNAGVACSRCHAAYPHPDGWNHMTTAGTVGEDTCLGCHAEGDGPSTMVASCGTRCHGGAR